MKIIVQIGIVFAVCLAGELIVKWIPFPFPASVMGMILLFLLLFFRILKPDHIRQKAEFMQKNMAVFFVPAGAGLLGQAEFLRSNGLALVVICVVSTLLTFFATLYTVKLVLALQRKWKGGHSA